MRELTQSITKYVEHMRRSGLSVSVHFSNKMLGMIPPDIFDMLCPYNVHTNPYCTHVKRCDNHKCIESQQRLISDGKTCVRICHAGVKEYVTPFFRKGEPSGIVSVSGYRESDGEEYGSLWRTSLCADEIPVEFAKTLVTPLVLMLEKLIESEVNEDGSEFNQIIQYLSEYYITADLDSICRHFHRSPSHISHLFRKSSGMTLRAYCNKLKLEKSRSLLADTDLPVTRIALDSGFGDVSHFINLFKKKYGLSPLAYRKALTKNRP